MRKVNRKGNELLELRLAAVQMSERDRERARNAVREAEAIVEAIMWTVNKIAALGTLLLRPGFKH